MSTWNPKANEIFLHVLELPTPGEREQYLDAACATDSSLRADVEALLAAGNQAGSFLESPAVAPYFLATVEQPIAERPVAERPGTIIGPYKLLEQIGEGGFGVVFMAEQQQPIRRKVALKVLKPGMDTRQVVARFEAERQALALMDHPNIAKVLDAGQTASGRPYFVMDLVRGIPITGYCDQNQLAPRERLDLFAHVCQAIQHAHQKAIIHRDIKPSNVLVTLHDGEPLVKVIDFGVAKALGQQLTDKTLFTGFAQLIGTPLYMSPEQAAMSNVDVDTRSDIYSLGVLLYELLTGTTPFDNERLKRAGYDEMCRIIRHEEPPKPSTRISTLGQAASTVSINRKSDPKRLSQLVRGELDWIVMKCLEKDRNRRYETANGLSLDVQRYLHHQPVQACPPSAAYRLRKFVRRNRTPLAVAGLILLFIALVGGGGGWLLSERAAHTRRVITERLEREAALDAEVDLALEEADSLRAQGKWREALAAVERGDQLLAFAGRAERPARLLDLHKELKLARCLEDIHQGTQGQQTSLIAARGVEKAAGDPGPRHSAEEEFFRGRDQDLRFAKEFRDFGIDIDALAPEEAAARIRRTGIRPAMVQALDEWAAMRKRARGDDDARWKKLLDVARQADADDWRNRCRDALEKRDRESLEELAQSIPIQEAPPATVYLLGQTLLDLGSVEKAAELLRAGQRSHPGDFWLNDALGYLSRRWLQPPRYDDAVRYYGAALAARPRSVPAHRSVADTLFAKGAIDEAMAQYAQAIELDANDPENWHQRGRHYRSLRQFEKAIADLTKAIELAPQLADALNERSIAYTKIGAGDKALADVNKVIELDPQSSLYRYNRGWLYQFGSGPSCPPQCDKAIADYSKAIDLSPRYVYAFRRRAECYAKQGRWRDASADCKKVEELEPDDAEVWCNDACLLVLQGDNDGYREVCRQALARFSGSADLSNLYLVARICHLAPSAVSDLGQPVKLAEKAVGDQPNVGWRRHTLGMAQYRAGQLEQAVQAFKDAMDVDPTWCHVVDWLPLAMAQFRLGRPKEARQWLSKARELIDNTPRNPDGTFWVGFSLTDQLECQLLWREAEALLGIADEKEIKWSESGPD
jgi:serine/threonine protein kinase/Flp pilus assembly protein TadD